MSSMSFWLAWVQAFLIVIALLMAGAAAHEYWLYRKDRE